MAQRVYIPFTDPQPDCLIRYIVEYKSPTDIGFNRAPDVFASPAVVDGLTVGVNYTFRITKECCDGTVSTPTTINYTPTSGDYPFYIVCENSASIGYSTANFGLTIEVEAPTQTVYSGDIPFNQSSPPYTVEAPPISAATTMPLEGTITLTNHIGNDTSYNYTISISDPFDSPISGTSFPYTGPIVHGEVLTLSDVNFGTSPNGYKVKITLTD